MFLDILVWCIIASVIGILVTNIANNIPLKLPTISKGEITDWGFLIEVFQGVTIGIIVAVFGDTFLTLIPLPSWAITGGTVSIAFLAGIFYKEAWNKIKQGRNEDVNDPNKKKVVPQTQSASITPSPMMIR